MKISVKVIHAVEELWKEMKKNMIRMSIKVMKSIGHKIVEDM